MLKFSLVLIIYCIIYFVCYRVNTSTNLKTSFSPTKTFFISHNCYQFLSYISYYYNLFVPCFFQFSKSIVNIHMILHLRCILTVISKSVFEIDFEAYYNCDWLLSNQK